MGSSRLDRRPGGNLGNSSAFGKAFIELKQLGLIDRLPRLALLMRVAPTRYTNSMNGADYAGTKVVPTAMSFVNIMMNSIEVAQKLTPLPVRLKSIVL